MKIIKKEFIDDNRNYYDLTIDGTHNFCLSDGEVVHNCGVGFSIQNHHVEKLPDVKKPNPNKTSRYLINDSIEGWADAIKMLMKSYLNGSNTIRFDYSDIRPKGTRLITSGGKAPGPQPLKDCIHHITKILSNKETGDRLTPIDCHDIICHIADAVLAGGIRRAALISLFNADDIEMLNAKTGNWWELNPQRGRANNSAVLLRHKITKEFFMDIWKRVEMSGAGEPGVYLSNEKDWGTNPCCFTGDTMVAVADGRNAVSIKELANESDGKVKFAVYSGKRSTISNQFGDSGKFRKWKPEISWAVAFKSGHKNIIRVHLSDGNIIKCTPDHLFALSNGEYVQAKDLVGHELQNFYNEHTYLPEPITVVKIEDLGEVEDVYDLNVEGNENFYIITETNDENYVNSKGVLVHNCEIALRPFQFCNLCEINASNIESEEDFIARIKAATLIGTLQATYTDFHYLRPIWQKTTEKDALIGISMTGIASNVIFNYDLEKMSKLVVSENKRIAKILGIKSAARTTCVKPSGCMLPSTEVWTNKGILTLEEIFNVNGYSLEDYQNTKDIFLPAIEDVYVRDNANSWQLITQLYVNGTAPTLDIELEDGLVVTVTPNHRFLTEGRGWVRADELDVTDILVDFSNQ